MEVIDKPGVLGGIASIFGKNNASLASVVQKQKNGETAPLVFITHETERKNINSALAEIKKFEYVTELSSIIVIENFK
jgi:homoserine dehydrogenase